jgi:hypothetical protein
MDELSGGAKSYMLGNARKPFSVSLVSKAKFDDRFLVFDLGLAPPPLDHPHHSCPTSILLVLFAGLDLFKPDPLEHERKHCARASLKLDHTPPPFLSFHAAAASSAVSKYSVQLSQKSTIHLTKYPKSSFQILASCLHSLHGFNLISLPIFTPPVKGCQ